MSYLNAYGKKRSQVGPAAAPVQAGPEQGGGGQEEEILALAQATVGGDQAAAAQLGAIAPMILQEVQAGGGGGEEEMAPQEAQPVFRKVEICRDNSLSNFLKYLETSTLLSNDEAGVSLLSY
jgi:hypothetical protein